MMKLDCFAIARRRRASFDALWLAMTVCGTALANPNSQPGKVREIAVPVPQKRAATGAVESGSPARAGNPTFVFTRFLERKAYRSF